MGLGPNVLGLYRQMKILGLFDGITDVVELGSQGVWCPDKRLLTGLFEAFGRPVPPAEELAPYLNDSGTGHAPSRHLHERLGFRYDCVDIDTNFGALALDLNFDSVPTDRRSRYGLTTNHGTTEHLINQFNAFKVIHDFTRPGGLMLHALPFTHLEHGFFNYQPNFFSALARYNSYQTLGVWIGIDWQLSSFVPWELKLMEFLAVNAKSTHLIVVLQRKLYDTEFRAPVQGIYESGLPEESASRYELVIDGEYYSGRRFTHLSRADIHENNIGSAPRPHASPNDFPAKTLIRNLVARALRRLFGKWL